MAFACNVDENGKKEMDRHTKLLLQQGQRFVYIASEHRLLPQITTSTLCLDMRNSIFKWNNMSILQSRVISE